jgi:hypothetical protein
LLEALIADHSHDLGTLGEAATDADAPTNRILAGEKPLRRGLIDDGDIGTTRAISLIERAALLQRQAQRS